MNLDPAIVDDIADEAFNGQQAIDMVQALNTEKRMEYCLVFMDCSMPIMDGYEASMCIRNYALQNSLSQPSIIALTGHVE